MATQVKAVKGPDYCLGLPLVRFKKKEFGFMGIIIIMVLCFAIESGKPFLTV